MDNQQEQVLDSSREQKQYVSFQPHYSTEKHPLRVGTGVVCFMQLSGDLLRHDVHEAAFGLPIWQYKRYWSFFHRTPISKLTGYSTYSAGNSTPSPDPDNTLCTAVGSHWR